MKIAVTYRVNNESMSCETEDRVPCLASVDVRQYFQYAIKSLCLLASSARCLNSYIDQFQLTSEDVLEKKSTISRVAKGMNFIQLHYRGRRSKHN